MSSLRRRAGGGTPVKPATARAWVKAWNAAGIRLQRLRRQRLSRLTLRETQRAMVAFHGAFRALQRRRAGRRESGLVELQAWFRRMRK